MQSAGIAKREAFIDFGIIAKNLCAVCVLIIGLAITSSAQDVSRITVDVGAGGSPLAGGIRNSLENGWHVTGGVGYRVTPRFQTSLDFTYDGFHVRQPVLDEAGVPDGNSHMWSLTVEPEFKLFSEREVTPYAVGGVGYYRRTTEFTQPTVANVVLFDPFFDVFFQAPVPANTVLGSITRGGAGVSGGAGAEIKLGDTGVKLFTEGRFLYADTGNVPTRMIPLTVGVRW